MPRRVAPATDLTSQSPAALVQLSGRPMVEVAEATLQAGRSMVAQWAQLEPIVDALIVKVKALVESDAITGQDAAKLLSLAAGTVQKVGVTAQGMFRSSDGLTRLALLLEGPARPAPQKLSEKQMVDVVIASVTRLAKERKRCVCGYIKDAVDVTPAEV